MFTVCWPGANPGRLNGVTQLGSVRPSTRIVAPSGVELIVNCPGATVGAAGIIVFCLRLLRCLRSLCGVFFISVTAFFATCRGCTLGFCGAAFLGVAALGCSIGADFSTTGGGSGVA